MEFAKLPEFEKDMKHLLKKYRSLDEDLDIVRMILSKMPDERPPFSFRIDNLGITTCVIKVKKIACKSLKGKGVNSGFRLIYAWFKEEKRIVIAELYYKSEKQTEDRQRLLEHFS